MSATRASIDRKIDALSERAALAKQNAARKSVIAAAGLATFAVVGAWWRRRAARARRRLSQA